MMSRLIQVSRFPWIVPLTPTLSPKGERENRRLSSLPWMLARSCQIIGHFTRSGGIILCDLPDANAGERIHCTCARLSRVGDLPSLRFGAASRASLTRSYCFDAPSRCDRAGDEDESKEDLEIVVPNEQPI
jgi:hypothetical protein